MKEYFAFSRAPWYSYLAALPLLVLYQVVAIAANLGQRRQVINGADALIQNALSLLGLHGWLVTSLVVAAVAGVVVFRADPIHRKAPLRTGYFGLMLAESAVYALLFGSVVAVLTSLVLPGYGFLQIGPSTASWGQKLAASLGAGLYEELVFRLLLTGGLIWLFRRFEWGDTGTVAAAVLASSLLFSLFHYVGPAADPFGIGSFMFRFIAGVVLAVLYSARGFAVAAWTHALYDVFLLLVGNG